MPISYQPRSKPPCTIPAATESWGNATKSSAAKKNLQIARAGAILRLEYVKLVLGEFTKAESFLAKRGY